MTIAFPSRNSTPCTETENLLPSLQQLVTSPRVSSPVLFSSRTANVSEDYPPIDVLKQIPSCLSYICHLSYSFQQLCSLFTPTVCCRG